MVALVGGDHMGDIHQPGQDLNHILTKTSPSLTSDVCPSFPPCCMSVWLSDSPASVSPKTLNCTQQDKNLSWKLWNGENFALSFFDNALEFAPTRDCFAFHLSSGPFAHLAHSTCSWKGELYRILLGWTASLYRAGQYMVVAGCLAYPHLCHTSPTILLPARPIYHRAGHLSTAWAHLGIFFDQNEPRQAWKLPRVKKLGIKWGSDVTM